MAPPNLTSSASYRKTKRSHEDAMQNTDASLGAPCLAIKPPPCSRSITMTRDDSQAAELSSPELESPDHFALHSLPAGLFPRAASGPSHPSDGNTAIVDVETLRANLQSAFSLMPPSPASRDERIAWQRGARLPPAPLHRQQRGQRHQQQEQQQQQQQQLGEREDTTTSTPCSPLHSRLPLAVRRASIAQSSPLPPPLFERPPTPPQQHKLSFGSQDGSGAFSPAGAGDAAGTDGIGINFDLDLGVGPQFSHSAGVSGITLSSSYQLAPAYEIDSDSSSELGLELELAAVLSNTTFHHNQPRLFFAHGDDQKQSHVVVRTRGSIKGTADDQDEDVFSPPRKGQTLLVGGGQSPAGAHKLSTTSSSSSSSSSASSSYAYSSSSSSSSFSSSLSPPPPTSTPSASASSSGGSSSLSPAVLSSGWDASESPRSFGGGPSPLF
ncbi:hypothetical protein OC842_003302 [Tilletia horrida]|uniref:Uncharacterized protein n=1 Tax=Tilletia horrida TaxID=155126 RepID=A0AAN6GBZ7_9BASI|nr:hypothetical protein OC842_003302 [Tilletia horrida]